MRSTIRRKIAIAAKAVAADTTPVNFLFYGVPTEVIDEVLAELLSCALAVRRHHRDYPSRVLELDRDVDLEGRLLEP